ncbi:MAG: hypothetical protein WCP28_19485 [Actinomycetes bacterium]
MRRGGKTQPEQPLLVVTAGMVHGATSMPEHVSAIESGNNNPADERNQQ